MNDETHNCPLCNGANNCAVACGGEVQDCWCHAVQLDARALANVPPQWRGRRCLCRDCAAKQGDYPVER